MVRISKVRYNKIKVCGGRFCTEEWAIDSRFCAHPVESAVYSLLLALKARNAMGTLDTGEGNAAECASHKTQQAKLG
jgi:hypothetical protein